MFLDLPYLRKDGVLANIGVVSQHVGGLQIALDGLNFGLIAVWNCGD